MVELIRGGSVTNGSTLSSFFLKSHSSSPKRKFLCNHDARLQKRLLTLSPRLMVFTVNLNCLRVFFFKLTLVVILKSNSSYETASSNNELLHRKKIPKARVMLGLVSKDLNDLRSGNWAGISIVLTKLQPLQH